MSASTSTLGSLGRTYGGLTGRTKSDFGHGDARYVTFVDVVNNVQVTGERAERVSVPKGERQSEVRAGDLLLNGSSETPEEVALAAVVSDTVPARTFLNSFCFGYRLDSPDMLLAHYLAYFFRSMVGRRLIAPLAQGAIRYNISKTKLMQLAVPIPDRGEMERIVSALRDCDELVVDMRALIEKRKQMALGVIQQLVSGSRRLPGFSGPWRDCAISDLFVPRSEVNGEARALEVLTCSKHKGFVRSLDYFNTQVFSRNLSGYRLVYRGDIAYPANHVEEGSIGLQELLPVALVSPIYVVMEPKPRVDSYFVYKILKQDRYRQKFAMATSASVDRRGSLRWPEFSKLRVSVPDFDEQQAVSAVLRDFEHELAGLEDELLKIQRTARGMSQSLMTSVAVRAGGTR